MTFSQRFLTGLACLTIMLAGSSPCSLAQQQAPEHTADELLAFIDDRQSELVMHAEILEVPFRYPARPTITARIADSRFELLLDSGTRLSILKLGSGTLPAGLRLVGPASFLADLDGGRPLSYDNHSLSYGQVDLLRSADLRIRNLPTRIYSYDEGPPAGDFDGSLALSSLRSQVLEFDNDDMLLRIHREYKPRAGASAVPLLILHNLILLQAGAGESPLLLAVDTGFSGELLLSSSAAGRLAQNLTPTGRTSEEFKGFHANYSGEIQLLDELALRSQNWPGTAGMDMEFRLVEVIATDSFRSDSALGEIDGILGAGLLSRCNYALDQGRSVIFLDRR